MTQLSTILLFLICLSTSCVDNDHVDKKLLGNQENNQKQDSTQTMLTSTEIIDHAIKAVNPKFKNWVLFSNGTYIIFEDSTTNDIKERAIEIMKDFGPVHPGSPAGDMTTIKLTYTDGWVVGGHYYGMYTYVHPKELEEQKIVNPTDLEIGLLGRKKRQKDGKDLNIIYVNK